MQEGKFRTMLGRLGDLTPRQRRTVVETLTETTALDVVVSTISARVAEAPRCPHCQGEAIQKWGQSQGIQRFR